jgi:CheY-like chemotaxis protein
MRKGGDSRVIMVVDDEDGNREILRIFLIWSGYIVIEASNGRDAVEIATTLCPDLILMDLAMPIMDGFNAVRLLREVPLTSDTPIVACTAHDTPTHRAQALSAGFDEFLTKPIDFIKLESTLDRFLKPEVDSM